MWSSGTVEAVPFAGWESGGYSDGQGKINRAMYRSMWDQASSLCRREDDCSCTNVCTSVSGSVGFLCFYYFFKNVFALASSLEIVLTSAS